MHHTRKNITYRIITIGFIFLTALFFQTSLFAALNNPQPLVTVLTIAESFLSSFGAIGFGGIVCFIVGSLFLFDTNAPGFALPWGLIVGVSIVSGLFLIGVMQLLLRARHKPVVSGTQTLIGKNGVIEKDGERFWVIVNGERWQVKSNDVLEDKQSVKIVRVDSLILIVESVSK